MIVKFHNEEYPSGVEFDVGGILLVNGESVEVSDEDLELYEARHGKSLEDALESVEFAEVSSTGTPTFTPPAPPDVETEEITEEPEGGETA